VHGCVFTIRQVRRPVWLYLGKSVHDMYQTRVHRDGRFALDYPDLYT